MKVGDVVRNVKFPMIEGIVTSVMSYHGIIRFRTQNNTEYSFMADQLEVVVECR